MAAKIGVPAGTTIGREKGRYAVSPPEVPEHGQAWTARALSAHDGWEMEGLGAGGRPVAVGCQKKNLVHPEGTAFRASPREVMCTETRLKKGSLSCSEALHPFIHGGC